MAVNNWQNPPQMAVVTQKTIKKPQETCETKAFIMAEDLKANAVETNAQKKKRSDGPKNGSAPVGQRDHETCATLVKPWWNRGETLAESSAEPFSSPRRIYPREPKTP